MHSLPEPEQEFVSDTGDPFRWCADAMPCIVLTAFADGGLDYFNARWHEVTGKSQDSHGLDAWLGVLHPDDKNGFVDLWRPSIEASQRVFFCFAEAWLSS
jgi:PAS domain-containing protein